MHRHQFRVASSVTSCVIFILLAIFVFSIPGCQPADRLEAIRQQLAAGKVEASLEPLRNLIAERPGDAEVLFLYGRALTASGQAGLAEWPLREAMKDPDWLVRAGLKLAADSARTRNFVSAVEIASQVLEAEPDNLRALLIRASAHAHSRMNLEEAMVDVERVLEIEPENMEIMEAKILSLIGLERIEEVDQAMEELGEKIDASDLGSGASAWHCATTAIFAADGGDVELADTRWTQCLEAYPSDLEVVAKAVPFYDGQGRYERSIAILRAAIEDDPNARMVRVRLATRLRAWGDPDEAGRLLREGTESDAPQIASAAWLDLAKHHQELQDYAAAAEAVGRAVEIVETISAPDADLLLEYADSLLIAGDFDRALEIADAMTYAPYQSMIRARVAQEQRNYELALEHFEKAFLLWPDNPFGRYYAALAAEALGDFDRAAAEYRQSIRIAAGATESRTRAAHLHLAENRPGAAIQLLRIKAHESPLEPEGEMLSLELWALTGRGAEIQRSLGQIRQGAPSYIGAALARVAKGMRDRAGPDMAVKSLRQAGEIDLTDPNYAEGLRALVEYSHEAGQGDEVKADLATAVAAHPELATLREIAAFRLELMGVAAEKVRNAYNAVLEVEPENARALAGLGRLAGRGDEELALSYFDRAIAADPGNAGLMLEAARALVALERGEEAEKRLIELLDEVPYDNEAAALLAQLHLGRKLASDRTLDLAGRAVRFGGGAEALELLARVHAERNEPALSEQAASRAKALREKQSS